jgi:hypothetical protein
LALESREQRMLKESLAAAKKKNFNSLAERLQYYKKESAKDITRKASVQKLKLKKKIPEQKVFTFAPTSAKKENLKTLVNSSKNPNFISRSTLLSSVNNNTQNLKKS